MGLQRRLCPRKRNLGPQFTFCDMAASDDRPSACYVSTASSTLERWAFIEEEQLDWSQVDPRFRNDLLVTAPEHWRIDGATLGTMGILDPRDGTRIPNRGFGGHVRSIAWPNDRRRLVVAAGKEQPLWVFNWREETPEELPGDVKYMHRACWSPDNRFSPKPKRGISGQDTSTPPLCGFQSVIQG